MESIDIRKTHLEGGQASLVLAKEWELHRLHWSYEVAHDSVHQEAEEKLQQHDAPRRILVEKEHVATAVWSYAVESQTL